MTTGCENDFCPGRKVRTVGQRGTHAADFTDAQAPWEYFLSFLINHFIVLFELGNNNIREA